MVTGDEKAGPYDYVEDLTFFSDGKILTYRAKIRGKWYVIAGKDKAGPYERLWFLSFSPDGIALAYRAEINGEWYSKVLINGKEYTGSVSNGMVVYVENDTIRILKDE